MELKKESRQSNRMFIQTWGTGHAAAVFVAWDAVVGILEPDIKQVADAVLSFPVCAEVVVEIGDVEGGFVAHGELPDQTGRVGAIDEEVSSFES